MKKKKGKKGKKGKKRKLTPWNLTMYVGEGEKNYSKAREKEIEKKQNKERTRDRRFHVWPYVYAIP